MSNTIRLRWALVGLLLAAVIAIIFFMPKPSSLTPSEAASSPASNGACDAANPGVTLVVDFGPASEESPIQKCVSNFDGNGWQLFEAAEVEVEGTAKYPEFACRIAGVPASDAQDCGENASFDKGYWSYFYADTDKATAWTMSPVGAVDRNPACGEFEGWAYVAADDASATPSVNAKPFACSAK